MKDNVMHYFCNATAEKLCKGHALQVNERRIAQNTAISAKYTESDKVENHVNGNRFREQGNITKRYRTTVIEPENNNTRQITNSAISEQYAPIGQRIFTEIPV